MTEEVKDDFDAAFEEVAHQAERTPEEVKADEAAAAEAARKAAEAARTPEQIAADAKAAEEAAAAAATETKKAEEEAAAAALANEKPEEKAAREAAEKKAAEDVAAAAATKASADAAAAEAARVAVAAKAAEETPEAKAAREALEASIKPYEPTEEEKAALATFEKEFPNEFKAMQARLKGVDKDINARVYAAVQDVMKQVAPRVAAVETMVGQSETQRHFAALHAAHPDYDAVIAKVPAWIDTLPSYARVGAKAVYDGGSTAEVAALVADYKKAAGVTSTVVADPVRKLPASDASDLAPVTTRRTTTAQKGAPDKNDYNGAWTELEAATK